MDRKQMRVLVEPLSNALKLQSITSFLKTQHAQTTFHIAVNWLNCQMLTFFPVNLFVHLPMPTSRCAIVVANRDLFWCWKSFSNLVQLAQTAMVMKRSSFCKDRGHHESFCLFESELIISWFQFCMLMCWFIQKTNLNLCQSNQDIQHCFVQWKLHDICNVTITRFNNTQFFSTAVASINAALLRTFGDSTEQTDLSKEGARNVPSRALTANHVTFSCDDFVTWLLSHDFITRFLKTVWCFYHMILSHDFVTGFDQSRACKAWSSKTVKRNPNRKIKSTNQIIW